MVHGLLAVRDPEGRDLGAEPEALARDRLLSDSVGDAARLRSVLVRPGRELLEGAVEVDESYFGGEEPALAGGRAKGKKVLVGIAVERHEPKGFGRCRMVPLADVSAETLRGFLADNVQEGATVITDGLQSYRPATAGLYTHERLVGSGRAETTKLLPGVHTVASLAKRWLLGTHQGRVDDAHLPGYLNEFVFRFNRRRSRSGGLVFCRVLELAAAHDPVRYRDLIANPRPGHRPPHPPPATRGTPPAWSVRPRTDPGGPPSRSTPARWISKCDLLAPRRSPRRLRDPPRAGGHGGCSVTADRAQSARALAKFVRSARLLDTGQRGCFTR